MKKLQEIADYYCKRAGLTLEDIRSECRDRDLVNCRHLIIMAAKKEGYSSPRTGEYINRSDSTVRSTINRRNKALLNH